MKYVELGWLVSDPSGTQSMAASLPASERSSICRPARAPRCSRTPSSPSPRDSKPVNMQKMTGFVSQVEFADGKVWVPNRESLAKPMLDKVVAPSAEEQRLGNVYRTKGLPGLIQELKKF